MTLHQAKVDKILDLIRRACANGTAREVAEALANDWSPTIEIDANGRTTFIIRKTAHDAKHG
jgi:hypothetical protein